MLFCIVDGGPSYSDGEVDFDEFGFWGRMNLDDQGGRRRRCGCGCGCWKKGKGEGLVSRK